MHPMEEALEDQDYPALGWMLWNCFLLEDPDSDERQLGETIYLSLSRRERAELENV